ncbi:MAG: type IV pilus modification protein PilV [Gammaproteobacteria bacterium]|nr:MAG: type IV pilus modification protein PilV [Gammaproteobacteria bacterium]
MLNFTSKRSTQYQSGMSLIEILVTVVILSIGLLGIAATQTVGVGYNHDSYLRSQATMMINELTERMSLNLDAVNNNDFNVNAFNMAGCGTAPAALCEGTVNCTPQQLATYDIYKISCGYDANGNDGITNIFPSGALAVACIDSDAGVDADPCTDGSNHQIVISWQRANLAQAQVQLVVRP